MKHRDIICAIFMCTMLFSKEFQDIGLSGFIKFDAFYDTHPMVAAREGHFALYPTDGSDKARLNFVMFQSRFRLTTPTYDLSFGRATGWIEADYFGTNNGYENLLRLRHSLIKLQLGKSSVIIGQYWTPFFNSAVYPGTVSFNTGVPFQPFARMPQIRITYTINNTISLISALTMQRDAFQEIGGNEKQIDAAMPGLHLHGRYSGENIFAGAGIYSKTINPGSETLMNALAFTVYGNLTLGSLLFKTKWIYGENLADHLMLGGYATLTDTLNDVRYENILTSSEWIDIAYQFSQTRLGLFLGWSTNLGMESKLNHDEIVYFYSRGSYIKQVKRVAPRIQIQWDHFRLAYEWEVTISDYYSGYNEQLVPSGIKNTTTNYRSLLAAYLFF